MELSKLSSKSLIKAIFFGNYFYGFCIVALSIEAGLQQRYPLNSFIYYAIVFIATLLYYTRAYIPSRAVDSLNPRTRWYARNKKEILLSQWLLTIVILVLTSAYIYQFIEGFLNVPLSNWTLLFLFPFIAVLYYGIDHHFFGKINLRSIGWLKPFIIGFIWAGTATVYPVIFKGIEQNGEYYSFNLVGTFLFIKNFMYITVLCIMFDIKDYAADSNKQIKTFVVNAGLRKTIFYIILPLSAVGLASFLIYAVDMHFSSMKIFMNVIPFTLLLLVAYSMHRRQSIFYYLAVIDGLMLVKGFCGSIAMIFF
jgi:hypothetical protein